MFCVFVASSVVVHDASFSESLSSLFHLNSQHPTCLGATIISRGRTIARTQHKAGYDDLDNLEDMNLTSVSNKIGKTAT